MWLPKNRASLHPISPPLRTRAPVHPIKPLNPTSMLRIDDRINPINPKSILPYEVSLNQRIASQFSAKQRNLAQVTAVQHIQSIAARSRKRSGFDANHGGWGGV